MSDDALKVKIFLERKGQCIIPLIFWLSTHFPISGEITITSFMGKNRKEDR